MKEIKVSKIYTCIVDDDDYERISKYKWFRKTGKYTYYAQMSYWMRDLKK